MKNEVILAHRSSLRIIPDIPDKSPLDEALERFATPPVPSSAAVAPPPVSERLEAPSNPLPSGSEPVTTAPVSLPIPESELLTRLLARTTALLATQHPIRHGWIRATETVLRGWHEFRHPRLGEEGEAMVRSLEEYCSRPPSPNLIERFEKGESGDCPTAPESSPAPTPPPGAKLYFQNDSPCEPHEGVYMWTWEGATSWYYAEQHPPPVPFKTVAQVKREKEQQQAERRKAASRPEQA